MADRSSIELRSSDEIKKAGTYPAFSFLLQLCLCIHRFGAFVENDTIFVFIHFENLGAGLYVLTSDRLEVAPLSLRALSMLRQVRYFFVTKDRRHLVNFAHQARLRGHRAKLVDGRAVAPVCLKP